MTTRRFGWTVLALLLALAAPRPAAAQTFSTADLEGNWRLFQLATPTGAVGGGIRSYRGAVSFDAAGVVTAGSLIDDESTFYTVSGSLTLTPVGLLEGTLALDDGQSPGTLAIGEARALTTKFTIVGTATVLGRVGLFTLVRSTGQTFTLDDDVASDPDGNGNYAYHEVIPSDEGAGTRFPGDANWSSGSITFHGFGVEGSGCTEANLVRADGTTRASRVEGDATSFG